MELFNIDNSGKFKTLSESDSISKSAYGFQCLFSTSDTICKAKRKNNTLFSQVAYATVCYTPEVLELTPINPIVNIEIVSLKEIAPNIPENSKVGELFNVFIENEFYTIDEYLQNNKQISDEFGIYALDFLLIDSSVEPNKAQFQVLIELENGKQFSDTTNQIILF